MQLFYQPELIQGANYLDPEESRHAIKVLRKQQGDTIDLIDGAGTFYKAEITEANFKKCQFSITDQQSEPKRDGLRHLAIAPTKNLDRTEWLVEKAVEIGVDRISFLHCQNSERTVLKIDRLIKKAISAMKQSIKATLPQIDEMVKLKSFLQQCETRSKFIAYVDFDNPRQLKDCLSSGQESVVLIGPEGDFDPAELQMAEEAGFVKVSLGESRLRTETAGLAAVHILNLFS
ncbi:16S rRNA (uracil(1498)-N(3))-methyltransferase [Roseivirga sp.]|uniref:16S rRNA (uracil(1498)-N(3))-methyltransferase n=1 Tax=Roseivirga sp. TaxID=1964215 RepID=UPI003B51A356